MITEPRYLLYYPHYILKALIENYECSTVTALNYSLSNINYVDACRQLEKLAEVGLIKQTINETINGCYPYRRYIATLNLHWLYFLYMKNNLRSTLKRYS
jgi:hypothetical protein